jgi:hypothetical protein
MHYDIHDKREGLRKCSCVFWVSVNDQRYFWIHTNVFTASVESVLNLGHGLPQTVTNWFCAVLAKSLGNNATRII